VTKKKRKQRTKRRKRSRPARPRRPRGGVLLTTPEGDALVFVTAQYQHAGMGAIRQTLRQAADFDLDDDLEPEPDGALQFGWYETDPGTRPTPVGRRVLATLTLTPTTLEVETMSEERLENCGRRLTELLGDRLHLLQTRRKSVDQVLQEEPSADSPEPLILPPEVIAEMEEQMLHQWINDSIPALDGLTPREAVKTPEGRQRVLDLLDYIERMQKSRPKMPGVFSPDYRKTKKMLGLE
jgi:hypothetical protein